MFVCAHERARVLLCFIFYLLFFLGGGCCFVCVGGGGGGASARVDLFFIFCLLWRGEGGVTSVVAKTSSAKLCTVCKCQVLFSAIECM